MGTRHRILQRRPTALRLHGVNHVGALCKQSAHCVRVARLCGSMQRVGVTPVEGGSPCQGKCMACIDYNRRAVNASWFTATWPPPYGMRSDRRWERFHEIWVAYVGAPDLGSCLRARPGMTWRKGAGGAGAGVSPPTAVPPCERSRP
eukprot:4142273-Prymnesium_polylepis.1